MEWITLIRYICIGLVVVGLLYLLYPAIFRDDERYVPIPRKEKGKFAVLIPARDESKVIRSLLDSIKRQKKEVAMEDVYVIVETKDDPTVSICEKYKVNVIYRKNLKKQRKGYALNDAITELLHKQKKYDAYFIFDADNILDSHYFSEMRKTYDAGYDIGIGYRNCKNGNQSIFAACSSLTFSMINTLGNEAKKRRQETMVISGTGFYISGKWIEKWGGYPFHSLTEDYELTMYATLYGLTTDYNKNAIFFDEQPTEYDQTVQQRIRWIRGYFDTRKKYIPLIRRSFQKRKKINLNSKRNALVGVKPYIMMVIGILGWILASIITSVTTPISMLKKIGWLILFIYFIMISITLVMLKKETGALRLSTFMKIQMAWFYPIYLITYIPCALKAVLKKEVTWSRIEHKETKLSKS